jgi:hypothetical protein
MDENKTAKEIMAERAARLSVPQLIEELKNVSIRQATADPYSEQFFLILDQSSVLTAEIIKRTI